MDDPGLNDRIVYAPHIVRTYGRPPHDKWVDGWMAVRPLGPSLCLTRPSPFFTSQYGPDVSDMGYFSGACVTTESLSSIVCHIAPASH